ncbi:WLM domain-containing protein [Kalaharituber pfeilii]|nr:WLM domain-containing protein [Kalaharituber pfeilii]
MANIYSFRDLTPGGYGSPLPGGFGSPQNRSGPVTSNGQLIGEFVILRGYSDERHAMKMLREIAFLVKPIMQKHGWRVGTLTEFWETPDFFKQEVATSGGVLLGYNHGFGALIALRLRHANNRDQFLPIDQIVQTMLHELTHNVYWDHNDDFHKLLNKLQWEYEQLHASGTGNRFEHKSKTSSGYNAEGLYSYGQILGTGITSHPELRELRIQALTGENRLYRLPSKPSSVTPVTTPGMPFSAIPIAPKTPKIPQKAGTPVQKGDRERIAQAAEKRRQEARRCGLGHGGDKEMHEIIRRGIDNGIREKPEPLTEDEMAAIMIQIKLLEEAERVERKNNGGRAPTYIVISDAEENPPPGRVDSKPIPGRGASASSPPSSSSPTRSDGRRLEGWTNHAQSRLFSECDHDRRGNSRSLANGLQWSCRACTLLNSASATKCSLCETSR